MGTNRKQKLRRREEKVAEAQARRRAVVDRLLRTFGLEEIVDQLPSPLFRNIEGRIEPGIEVVAADDCRDDPLVKWAVRQIRVVLKRPVWGMIGDREYYLAPEDPLRGYRELIATFRYYIARMREPNPRIKNLAEIRALLTEARRRLVAFDRRWFYRVTARLMCDVTDVTDVGYRLDGRMLSARMTWAIKPEGTPFRRLIVKLHTPKPRVATIGGDRHTLHPCRRSEGPYGMETVTWNCAELGIEGPSARLPVLISEHAILRLEQRLPMSAGMKRLLHVMTLESLQEPILHPAERGRHLVAARLGDFRLGYFVVEVTAGFVWVITFLFLTMAGTPEAACLRDKVGLSRKHIEDFRLDSFRNLFTSNIGRDPLLAPILAECGCGHLFRLAEDIDPEVDWIGTFGDRLKSAFDLREAPGGFRVGRKWVGWSRRDAETDAVGGPPDEPGRA